MGNKSYRFILLHHMQVSVHVGITTSRIAEVSVQRFQCRISINANKNCDFITSALHQFLLCKLTV